MYIVYVYSCMYYLLICVMCFVPCGRLVRSRMNLDMQPFAFFCITAVCEYLLNIITTILLNDLRV